MKNTMLIILGIVIIILLLLLYFNYKGDKQVEVDRQAEREIYEDSIRTYEQITQKLIVEKTEAVNAKTQQLQRDSIAKGQYERKIKRLEKQVDIARTEHVDSLIEAEPELKAFVVALEVVTFSQALRIDSLEVEKRIQEDLNKYIASKQEAIFANQQGELNFLKGEVDKKDKEITKLEKKLKRARRWAGFFGLLNLVPRGGNY
jgi:FtsZ-interacting cell division protein ZipA